ncbi:threonine synthase [Flavihumibacter sp. R14]|nr:threonine synthase [Flavihumibacter soli]
MKFYSTNSPSLKVDFKEAVFNSFPLDKGLYMPEDIPKLEELFIQNIEKYSLQEIAFEIARTLLTGSIPDTDLRLLIEDAINFPAPIVKLGDNTYVLELFHGPSLAFKDFGARFMSRVMSYYLRQDEKLLDILVATSGDTGGAVALGFLGVPGTRVTILYPEGKVSEIQELQLTTNDQNIRALAVKGTFDDCQALVKQAFTDPELSNTLRLTSANSINIARLIPQTFYYFNAFAQLKREGRSDVVFSVPSGNFGNIAAGLLAWKMGLPVKQFLAATNVNDTVPVFLKTGEFKPKASVQTYSNAMDVGDPSNWIRIMELFKGDINLLKQLVTGYSYTDAQTVDAMDIIGKRYGYVACPHTAIAWMALEDWFKQNPDDVVEGVFLSTAHPCKFPEVIPQEVSSLLTIPEQVTGLKSKQAVYDTIEPDFETFKSFLLAGN